MFYFDFVNLKLLYSHLQLSFVYRNSVALPGVVYANMFNFNK